jgi:hypothetical protein
MKALLLSTLAVTAAMCGPEPKVGDPIPGAGEIAPTLDSIQVNVFTPSCATASCHSGSASPALDPGLAWDALVGQPSVQQPATPLVDPGNPSDSYLLIKLRGGGDGSPMPIGAPSLGDADLVAIETWIQNGAPK